MTPIEFTVAMIVVVAAGLISLIAYLRETERLRKKLTKAILDRAIR